MSKILLLVEGKKLDVRLMKHFYQLYDLSNIEIVSYETEIYSFYKRLKTYASSADTIDYEMIDLPLFLKEIGKMPEENFNDMDFVEKILIFDFDPQDQKYDPSILTELMENFSNSTENGKLYLNYPMVESFKDMESLEDTTFLDSTYSLKNLQKESLVWIVNTCILHLFDEYGELG